MSRPLLILAATVLLLAGLLPIGVMLVRLGQDPSALGSVTSSRTMDLLGRTFLLGGSVAAIAMLVGAPFGFLVARTDMPGARLLRPLGFLPLLMPPLVTAMTWTVLVDLRGAPMTIALLSLSTFPIVALFASRAAERIDGRTEEAALLAGGLRAAVRAAIPQVLPAAACGACLAFVFAVNDWGVPDYVSSVGPKFNVYADEVFATWQIDEQDAQAVATALPLVLLTLLALIPALILRRRGALAAGIGSGFVKPAPLALGPWRWPALLFCLTLLALGAGVPIGRLIYEAGAGAPGGQNPSGQVPIPVEGFDTQWTFDRMRAAFARALELCRDELTASTLYSAAGATIAAAVGLVLGHAAARAKRGGLLLAVSVLPIAVPAILLGIGFIVVWNRSWTADFYSGPGLVVLLLLGRYLAFPILVLSGAAASLDPQLEESAQLAGASPTRRLFGVVAPPLVPSIFGAWTLFFVLAMREMDAAVLVPAANRTVMFRLFNAIHFGRDDFVAALALLTLFVIILPGLLWTCFAKRRMEVLP